MTHEMQYYLIRKQHINSKTPRDRAWSILCTITTGLLVYLSHGYTRQAFSFLDHPWSSIEAVCKWHVLSSGVRKAILMKQNTVYTALSCINSLSPRLLIWWSVIGPIACTKHTLLRGVKLPDLSSHAYNLLPYKFACTLSYILTYIQLCLILLSCIDQTVINDYCLLHLKGPKIRWQIVTSEAITSVSSALCSRLPLIG